MKGAWKRASRSEGANNCVELAWAGMVRDSKNPAAGVLPVDVARLVSAVKAGRLNR